MRFVLCVFGLVAVAFVSGCGKQPGVYGNFAEADSVELVQDAVNALSTNFPPAKTRLALVQETEDAFGVALVEGYGRTAMPSPNTPEATNTFPA